MTVLGKMPSLRKGAARESPPRVSSATWAISLRQHQVADGVFDNFQRGQQRDAALGQRAQRARKPSQGRRPKNAAR